jgi:hypothetical protein
MRDLVRAEIDHGATASRVQKMLGSAWFLAGLLALILVGGYFAVRSRGTSDEPAANDDERNANWIRTRKRQLRQTAPTTEAEKFVHQALHLRDIGETDAAESKLAALKRLLAEDAEQAELLEWVDELLAEIHASQSREARRYELLYVSMARADRLAEAGRRDEARSIWQGIVELYGSDADARETVGRAKRLLEVDVTSSRAADAK